MDAEEQFHTGSAAFEADDFATAVIKLLPLAKDGHMHAQFLMAEMYRWGNGVSQNSEESFRFYKAAADQGHARAAFDLGFILFTKPSPPPMESLPKDSALSQHYLGLAVARFKEQAEVGDVEAMANLGFLFHCGIGVELDGAEAIRWYTKALEGGDLGASNGLCLVYYEGDPRVRDKAKARLWYMKTKEFNCRCIGITEFENPTTQGEIQV